MALAPNQIVAHGAAIHAAILHTTGRAVLPLGDGARRIDSDRTTTVPDPAGACQPAYPRHHVVGGHAARLVDNDQPV